MDAGRALLLLLLIPFAASPVIYLTGRLSVLRQGTGLWLARWFTLIVYLGMGLPLYTLGRYVLELGPVDLKIGRIVLQMDGLGLFLAVTVWLLSTLVTIFSFPYIRGEEDEEKYYALLPALSATMIGLGCTRDLFNLWVWFEAMAITSYLLVAFYHHQKGALEATVKYLVQSAVGSIMILHGISLVFARTMTLDLQEIPPLMADSGLFGLAAGALFVVGFGVKIALAPLHTWLPDAHSRAPSGISAMLSGVVIESGLVALLRALGTLSQASPAWGALLLGFGAINILIGNLMALRQEEVKRMLAYSSVAQVGYMLLGFGVAMSYGIADGAEGGFYHLFNHALMKGLAFLAVGAFLYALYITKGSHAPLMVSDLDGASKKYPLTAFALSIALLALGGLPPLAGFVSKWQIFVAGAEVRSTPLLWLIIFAGLNSVLSLGYYAPLINRMYRNQPSEVVQAGQPIAVLISLPLLILTLAIVAIGFFPGWMVPLNASAASSLLMAFGFR
ncbi:MULTISPECIES: complex I subunit 5 family protein [Anaerolinea]|jgi:proton-translocating NADH-quinone oxidoreductase chain N|uniref:complex I subunit 5 family protein n=1 Tax=Anaerolinea TaxID=233189 RepID=UPI00261A5823|nr:proton-conducting transporter membrane subunit [Anaerolinea thermophila]